MNNGIAYIMRADAHFERAALAGAVVPFEQPGNIAALDRRLRGERLECLGGLLGERRSLWAVFGKGR